jgi:hypothetical protein
MPLKHQRSETLHKQVHTHIMVFLNEEVVFYNEGGEKWHP